MWEIWCKTLGAKAYDDKCKADKVALIRTAMAILVIIANITIILNNTNQLVN